MFFYFSLPSKFLTKPLRVLEDEVNKQTNKTEHGKAGEGIIPRVTLVLR